MSALHWNDVKQLASMNQDGASGFPPHWVMKHLEENLDIAPLRFGGDDYGYLMWFRPQAKSVVDGMRVLKGTLADFDDAMRQIEELRSEVERLRGDAPRPAPVAMAPVVLTKEPEVVASGSGEEAYALRLSGLAWPAIGAKLGLGSPLNAAKKHAKNQGLSWPPAAP
jgi:hypothetical protein